MTDPTFTYFLEDILQLKKDSEVHVCLIQNYITSARDIAMLEEGAIDLLEYKVQSVDTKLETSKQMAVFHRQLVRIAVDFIRMKQHENGGTITDVDILNFDRDEWENFRVKPREFRKSASPTMIASTTTAFPSTPRNLELESFQKGTKRDKTQYDELKDERNFEIWKIEFLATAHSHKLEDVFNHTYVPRNQDEIDIFQAKQSFAFSVLARTLKTDYGKILVRQYAPTRNAQRIWYEFVTDMKSSTKAELSAAEV